LFGSVLKAEGSPILVSSVYDGKGRSLGRNCRNAGPENEGPENDGVLMDSVYNCF